MKKKLLSVLLAAVMVFSLLPVTAKAATPPWAQPAVDALVKVYGSGVGALLSDDRAFTYADAYAVLDEMGFKPVRIGSGPLTRGAACDLLADVFKVPVENGKTAIQYLNSVNIVNGTPSGLGENDTITTAQFAVLAYRVMNLMGVGMCSTGSDGLKPGTDEWLSCRYLEAHGVDMDNLS